MNPPKNALLYIPLIFSVVSLTTINTPIIENIIAPHSDREYFSFRKIKDKIAEKMGTVANDVKTIKTDEFEIPIIKAID